MTMNIATVAAGLEPFKAGGRFYPDVRNFRGGPSEDRGPGRLPIDWAERFAEAEDRIDYVVYSYYTPIAWHTPDGWTVPPVRYSPSTTRHQAVMAELVSA